MLKNNSIWYPFWALLVITSVFANPKTLPHIVFIMVDDMGWNDVSFHGSDQILTPNIDTLAYRGIILQNYYSEAICTPARSALLTGQYPMRLGMQGTPLLNSEDRGIPVTEELLPSYLKKFGYSTHLVGKWHVGMSRDEYLPTYRGYDSHFGIRGGFVDSYTYNKVESWPNGRLLFGLDLFANKTPQVNEDRYSTDAFTDEAVEIIRYHNTSAPLFLHVAHNAPHAGNEGGALQPPLNSTVEHRHIAHSDRRLYAEIVERIDQSVGQIVAALAEKNILHKTLIVFVSDNGAPTVGMYRNWGVNLPLRGIKWTPWEGGVRVPALMWHSSFTPGVWNGLMHITDWLPTLTAAAGGIINKKMDGLNQWDAIVQGGDSKRKEILVAIEDNISNTYGAYRSGDYKVIIGNVKGLTNNYYGSELMINKAQPPAYFPSLKSCEVAKILECMGLNLDEQYVEATRKAVTIKQLDPVRDPIPCVPTPNRGCLFNVRQDPTESHDLWISENKIAIQLTSRLRTLRSMEMRRGITRISNDSDPANFNYIWTPWINTKKYVSGDDIEQINLSDNTEQTDSTTNSAFYNCDGPSVIKT